MGTKRHLLVDERGVPLSLIVTGANRHDVTQLEIVLDCIVAKRPEVTEAAAQNLCGDKAYDFPSARMAIAERGYSVHVRSRGEEKAAKKTNPKYRAKRWVVEACHSWLNRFRKLLVRFEKTDAGYEALLHLACSIIVWRRIAPKITSDDSGRKKGRKPCPFGGYPAFFGLPWMSKWWARRDSNPRPQVPETCALSN